VQLRWVDFCQVMSSEINNMPVENYDDIEKTMKYNKVGDKVNIKVNRSGKEITIPLQLRKSF
jgi:S1-C subfamily serine protease